MATHAFTVSLLGLVSTCNSTLDAFVYLTSDVAAISTTTIVSPMFMTVYSGLQSTPSNTEYILPHFWHPCESTLTVHSLALLGQC